MSLTEAALAVLVARACERHVVAAVTTLTMAYASNGDGRGKVSMFEGFVAETVDAGETSIFLRRGGSGPPLLLLHGFPQTHLVWRQVAPELASGFTVVCADLRGYGRSGCPPSAPDHAPYAKRAMAADMVEVMVRLGFAWFAVAGHDRGGHFFPEETPAQTAAALRAFFVLG